MSKDNIDDISIIEKEKENFFKDESTMSIFNTLLTMSTPSKAPIQRTPSIKDSNQKELCLFKHNIKKDNAKVIKAANSSPTAIINKQTNIIDIKPVSEFLSNQDSIRLSYPQSEYMAVLDSLYSLKIKKMNEIDAKYDSELFSLREYLDGNDGNNINNIIYNSILKDKMEELKTIEKEFCIQKEKASELYKQRNNRIKEVFASEIYTTVNSIKNDVLEQLAKLNNQSIK